MQITPSKENARIARQYLAALCRETAEGPTRRFIRLFLEAAERRLPREETFIRAAERRRLKGGA